MKYVYITLGFICVGLGAAGVFVPILPTVPFLLAASFLFAKGSTRFHDWFVSTKLYKNNLESFEKNRSMTLKTKLCILIPVTILLAIEFVMMGRKPGMGTMIGRIVIVVLVVVKYWYFVFKIKTVPGNKA